MDGKLIYLSQCFAFRSGVQVSERPTTKPPPNHLESFDSLMPWGMISGFSFSGEKWRTLQRCGCVQLCALMWRLSAIVWFWQQETNFCHPLCRSMHQYTLHFFLRITHIGMQRWCRRLGVWLSNRHASLHAHVLFSGLGLPQKDIPYRKKPPSSLPLSSSHLYFSQSVALSTVLTITSVF